MDTPPSIAELVKEKAGELLQAMTGGSLQESCAVLDWMRGELQSRASVVGTNPQSFVGFPVVHG
jgi:hypothetical protein